MNLVIGIDVSKNFIDVAYRQGHQVRTQHFNSNDRETALGIMKEVSEPWSEVCVVMEATGSYHLKLATGLFELGCRVCVENPLSIKRYAQMKLSRAKTDRYDAKVIAEYGASQEVHPWEPRQVWQEELRQCVKALEDCQKMKTEVSNRLEGLNQYSNQSEQVLGCLNGILVECQNQINGLRKEMTRLGPLAAPEAYELMQSIPSIGPTVAAALAGQFGNFKDFENAKQVVAAVGLNPAPCQSGISVKGKGGISKRGHSYLRSLLYMAAMTAKKGNATCRAMYDRLVAKGSSKRKALVAIAHKLLRQAFGVVKSGNPYDPNYLEKLC